MAGIYQHVQNNSTGTIKQGKNRQIGAKALKREAQATIKQGKTG